MNAGDISFEAGDLLEDNASNILRERRDMDSV
jgi:hypothetical protein